MNIYEAIKLREDGRCEEALTLLKELLVESPNNGEIYYQLAWCNDVLERENEAVPYYEKAIELGLSETDLKGAYLGLGSTLRTLGRYNESKTVLNSAIALFPNNNEFKVFYSMVLYNVNECDSAMNLLLNLLADTTKDTNILAYSRAIRFYSDKLSRIWK